MNYQCNKSNIELNVKFFLRLQIYFIRIPIQLSYTQLCMLIICIQDIKPLERKIIPGMYYQNIRLERFSLQPNNLCLKLYTL